LTETIDFFRLDLFSCAVSRGLIVREL
jgi:hypothetical protein